MIDEHHYTSASEPERVDPAIPRASALEALKHGPRGALVIATFAVGLLLVCWLLFYFLLFLSRGHVG
jgi:hypothetical protein